MHTSRAKYAVYGLLILGFMVMFLSSSIKSVYQVYFDHLADYFGSGRAGFAWSASVFVLAIGLTSPLAGAISDRYGPLRTIALGAAVAGAGMIIASFSGAIGNTTSNAFSAAISARHAALCLFVLAYGLASAFGLTAMTYVPMGVLVDRLFEQRRTGFAYALVTNGTAVGFIVLSPFWLWLQPLVSWRDTFFATGLLFIGPLACATALVAFISPIDAAARSNVAQKNSALVSAPPPAKISAWHKIKADLGFYALAAGFFGCGSTMAFIDVHLVAFWHDMHTPLHAMSNSMILLGTLELAGGLASGWLANHYDPRRLLAGFYLLRALSLLLLFSHAQTARTLWFSSLFGTSYLGTVVLTSMFCLKRYGPALKGRIFGILFFVHQAGVFCAVQLGAFWFDHAGNYRGLIAVLALLTATSALAVWVGLREPDNRIGKRKTVDT